MGYGCLEDGIWEPRGWDMGGLSVQAGRWDMEALRTGYGRLEDGIWEVVDFTSPTWRKLKLKF